MKVVTGKTMQYLDSQAMSTFGIPGEVLMENAGSAAVEHLCSFFPPNRPKRALVIAGKGNNGGDGYVVARLLKNRDWQVKVIIAAKQSEISGDALVNLERLDPTDIFFCDDPGQLPELTLQLSIATVIIDALFGTGLASDVRGLHAVIINLINDSDALVVSLDIPSGIDATTGKVFGFAVKADLTVTFACAKLGHVLYPGVDYVGELAVADIGIPAEITASADGFEFVDAQVAEPLLKKRDRTAHKGNFGHALIIAGSPGKTGAAVMSTNSAIRSGSGLVTLATPAKLHEIVEIKTTEAMTYPVPDIESGLFGECSFSYLVDILKGKAAAAIGPGVGTHQETFMLLRRLLAEISIPSVVDADALNAVSRDLDLLAAAKSTIVMTPHSGEMARLCGVSVDEIEVDRISAARNFAQAYGIYLILKGARTVIASPDGSIAINGSGNPGMATGGMGDVLTGIVVSLLGQGYEPYCACKLAVYIHGRAGDLVAEEKGEIGMNAVDVQERLPYVFKELSREHERRVSL